MSADSRAATDTHNPAMQQWTRTENDTPITQRVIYSNKHHNGPPNGELTSARPAARRIGVAGHHSIADLDFFGCDAAIQVLLIAEQSCHFARESTWTTHSRGADLEDQRLLRIRL